MSTRGGTEQAWPGVAEAVLAHVRSALGFEMAVLSRRSGDDYVVLAADDDQYGVRAGQVLPWRDTFCARAADGRAPRIAPDAAAVPAYVEASALLGMQVGAYVSVPLLDEDGTLVGTLCGASPRRHDVQLHEFAGLLEVLAASVGALLASELRREREGLPRYAPAPSPPPGASVEDVLLQELLDLARRHVGAAIAFIGEWRGGPSGVRVMRGVSSAVPIPVERGHTESLDTTYCQRIVDGRLPRVIPDTSREPEALALDVTSRLPIGSYVGIPVVLSDGQLYGTLCCLSPTPDASLSDRDADFLTAVAGSMSRVLEAEQREHAVRTALDARLDAVLGGHGLSVVFQPVVDMADGRLVGVEALARFGADGKGAPGPWFADAGVVGRTAELELAAARLALAAAPAVPGFLALNFSATTICTPAFAALMAEQDLCRLVVEVSEHEQIDDYAPVLAALRPWRAAGTRIAVDDAGAGFASLRHVVLLAPDIIKLDLSLVRGIDDDRTRQALAAALTTFARSAVAQVVAEGVETDRERDVLRQAGVTLAQGWLFGAGESAVAVRERHGSPPHVPEPRPSAAARVTG